MPTILQVGFWLVTVLCAGGGAYFGAYLKKRGENLATKEDFNDLKEQTRQLTQATKEIEARISNEVWDRQRRWELKRDSLLEALRSIGAFNNAYFGVIVSCRGARKAEGADPASWIRMKSQAASTWIAAQNNFESARLLATLVGGEKINTSFEALGAAFRDSYSVLKDGLEDPATTKAMARIERAMQVTTFAVREELGLIQPYVPRPQSNESSAAPTPD